MIASGIRDTVVTYDIDGISAEGAKARARYINGKIVTATMNIYGETGQAVIVYGFEGNRIKVSETRCSYKTCLGNVKSAGDMDTTLLSGYYIDYEGNVIGEPVPERLDIFMEFKSAVPFVMQ